MPLDDLMIADSPATRSTALNALIEYWLGPRQPHYGVDTAALAEIEMPDPLASLYRFAGAWPRSHPDRRRAQSPFCMQDCLRPLDELCLNNAGQLVFLDENQGCFECATDTSGPDAPVYMKEEGRKSRELALPLSRFLVTYCLQELLFGARFRSTDSPVVEWAESRKADWQLLWEAPYTGKRKSRFYLLDERILVGKAFGFTSISANDEAACDELRSRRGPIRSVWIHVQKPVYDAVTWNLRIVPDGSATFGIFGNRDKVELPAGTFDFQASLQALRAVSIPQGRQLSAALIFIDRVGREGGLSGDAITDQSVAEDLYTTALACDESRDFRGKFAADAPFTTD